MDEILQALRWGAFLMGLWRHGSFVISSVAACRYGADGNRSDDTLSREISRRNAARTIRGGDFSTPLRYGRNDEGRGLAFLSFGA